MATLTTSWQNIANYTWVLSGYGTSVTFYLDAKYSSQSIANNSTDIQTRLNCVLNSGSVSGSGYNFTCSYAPTVSGSGVWNFETETITSGSGTITHNSDGTKSITLSASMQNNYWGLNKTISATVSLPSIPRQANLSSAQDFTDEGNPTITYTNSAGSNVSSLQACIANTAGSVIYAPYRDVNKTGTLSYTFNLTDTERNNLRNATPNSKTMAVKFYLKTVIGGSTYYSTMQKTLTIVNGEPTLTYTAIETDEDVIDIVGTNTLLIKNVTKPQITLTATPKKSASISSYLINLNGVSYNTQTATFPNLTGNQLTYSATDSRGFNTTSQTTLSVIDYFKPLAQIALARTQEGEDTCYVTIDGTWFNDDFGNVSNTLSITWDYRESDSDTWITGGTINPTIDDNTFGVEDYLLGSNFNYAREYKIRFTITDLFNQVVYTKTRTKNDYELKDTYYESDILTYEDMLGIEDYIYATYQLLNKQMGTLYSYTMQEWYKSSPMLVSKLNHIETGIKNLGSYYYRPEGWQKLKTWNSTKPQKFDYTDVNRWITNLNIITDRLYNESNTLFPSDTLYPSETLLPH